MSKAVFVFEDKSTVEVRALQDVRGISRKGKRPYRVKLYIDIRELEYDYYPIITWINRQVRPSLNNQNKRNVISYLVLD